MKNIIIKSEYFIYIFYYLLLNFSVLLLLFCMCWMGIIFIVLESFNSFPEALVYLLS